jgi:hypothetical protein
MKHYLSLCLAVFLDTDTQNLGLAARWFGAVAGSLGIPVSTCLSNKHACTCAGIADASLVIVSLHHYDLGYCIIMPVLRRQIAVVCSIVVKRSGGLLQAC